MAETEGFDFACGRFSGACRPALAKNARTGGFSGAAGPFAALRLHWSLIHCRSVRIPHAKKAPMRDALRKEVHPSCFLGKHIQRHLTVFGLE